MVFPDGGCPMKRRRCSTLVAMSIASVEAQKQLDRIVALGYPDVADISAAAFRSLARPLIGALEHSDLGSNILLVPTRELVSPESLIARTSINRMAGFTTMPPRDIASFLASKTASCRRKARSIWSSIRTPARAMSIASRMWPANLLTPMSACRSHPRGRLGHRHPAPGGGCWKRTKLQSARLTLRRRTRAEHLDEPERTATGSQSGPIPAIYWLGNAYCTARRGSESVPLKRFSLKKTRSVRWMATARCRRMGNRNESQ